MAKDSGIVICVANEIAKISPKLNARFIFSKTSVYIFLMWLVLVKWSQKLILVLPESFVFSFFFLLQSLDIQSNVSSCLCLKIHQIVVVFKNTNLTFLVIFLKPFQLVATFHVLMTKINNEMLHISKVRRRI